MKSEIGSSLSPLLGIFRSQDLRSHREGTGRRKWRMSYELDRNFSVEGCVFDIRTNFAQNFGGAIGAFFASKLAEWKTLMGREAKLQEFAHDGFQ